jgi:hypothetical protein
MVVSLAIETAFHAHLVVKSGPGLWRGEGLLTPLSLTLPPLGGRD